MKDFYLPPGPMTELSACAPTAFDGLLDDPVALMKAVRGCIIEKYTLSDRYKLPVPERDDIQVRPAASLVERILSLDPRPLANEREPSRRMLGTCRHYATLSCALLRRAGVPTRVRAGFASYYRAETWLDHWIIEYERDGAWVRVDQELDDDALAAQGLTAEGLATTGFLSGCEAWGRCRSGELDPETFEMGGHRGIGEVRGSVLYDIAALNKDEMLPWDVWGRMAAGYKGEAGDEYDLLLDEVSAVAARDDVDEVRALYESRPELRVPPELSGRTI